MNHEGSILDVDIDMEVANVNIIKRLSSRHSPRHLSEISTIESVTQNSSVDRFQPPQRPQTSVGMRSKFIRRKVRPATSCSSRVRYQRDVLDDDSSINDIFSKGNDTPRLVSDCLRWSEDCGYARSVTPHQGIQTPKLPITSNNLSFNHQVISSLDEHLNADILATEFKFSSGVVMPSQQDDGIRSLVLSECDLRSCITVSHCRQLDELQQDQMSSFSQLQTLLGLSTERHSTTLDSDLLREICPDISLVAQDLHVSDSFLSMDKLYRQQSIQKYHREDLARIWWAEDIVRQNPSMGKPLEDLLRIDLLSKTVTKHSNELLVEEQSSRQRIENLNEYITTFLVDELRGGTQHTMSASILLLLKTETDKRSQTISEEVGSRNLFDKWREIEGLINEEYDMRHDIIEEEINSRIDISSIEETDRPTEAHEVRHQGVGTSNEPMCTLCGFRDKVRFCSVTGEPHVSWMRCNICGLDRIGNRYCSATGEEHDQIFHPREGFSFPIRSTGLSKTVRPMRQQALSDAYTKGLSGDGFLQELKLMIAPRMVLDLCMELHKDKGIDISELDEIFIDSLSHLGMSYEPGTLLPSCLDVDEDSDDSSSHTPKDKISNRKGPHSVNDVKSEARSATGDEDTKSNYSQVRKKSTKQVNRKVAHLGISRPSVKIPLTSRKSKIQRTASNVYGINSTEL